ncbi:HNH endonuclease [Algoriphagus aestuariicola]|uniref:HNH endonuclease n=1 Tax=Algoriphagus aestuariicola TaxID=1852016 RepID=A0ABS3BJG7_9BACT|nr:HNH endonuclease [Algoriphagus aestuariicola]
MGNRWGIPKDVETQVRERDLSCVYCGTSFTNSAQTHKTRATWEHIVNDVKLNNSDNIALCCRSCNSSKGSKLLKHWLECPYCLRKGITKDSVATIVEIHLSQNNKI